jgi:hypothetical protein
MLSLIRSFVARVYHSLGSRQSSPKSQSIFELIAGQLALDPNWQMDESLFPKILVSGHSELSFAPGALDAVIR